jgi:Kef-type K+ transport system membrane component KefB
MNVAGAPVPPLGHDALLVFLLQVGLLLLLAIALGRLAVRFGMPSVVGELSVGVLLGPSVLDTVAPSLSGWLLPKDPEQMHLLDAFGQVGVLMLVAFAGMHMDLGLIRRRGGAAAGISAGGLVVPLGLGIAAGLLVPTRLLVEPGDRGVFVLYLGVAMCVSALPVIAKTLIDMNLMHRNVGQLTMTAGMVDDAFGWMMLSIVSALATTGFRAGQLGLSVLYLTLFVAVATVAGRPLVRRAIGAAARSGNSGPVVATAVVIVLLGSAASHALRLEAVFGAFVCGILIGTVAKEHRARLAPLGTVTMSVLAPIFFAVAGLRVDITALADPLVLVSAIALLLVAVVGKFAGAYAGARASRLGHWEGIALGAGMNARGVIEIVVAMVGLRLGILTVEVYTIIVLIAIATSLMAPPILRRAMARVELTAEEELRHTEQRSLTTVAAPPRP